MQKTNDMPIWVFLAFSSIESRKVALWLIWSCVAFTLYCVPWASLYDGPEWLKRVFRLDDWEWFAWMVPLTLWYYLSLRWLDRNGRWEMAE